MASNGMWGNPQTSLSSFNDPFSLPTTVGSGLCYGVPYWLNNSIFSSLNKLRITISIGCSQGVMIMWSVRDFRMRSCLQWLWFVSFYSLNSLLLLVEGQFDV